MYMYKFWSVRFVLICTSTQWLFTASLYEYTIYIALWYEYAVVIASLYEYTVIIAWLYEYITITASVYDFTIIHYLRVHRCMCDSRNLMIHITHVCIESRFDDQRFRQSGPGTKWRRHDHARSEGVALRTSAHVSRRPQRAAAFMLCRRRGPRVTAVSTRKNTRVRVNHFNVQKFSTLKRNVFKLHNIIIV